MRSALYHKYKEKHFTLYLKGLIKILVLLGGKEDGKKFSKKKSKEDGTNITSLSLMELLSVFEEGAKSIYQSQDRSHKFALEAFTYFINRYSKSFKIICFSGVEIQCHLYNRIYQ